MDAGPYPVLVWIYGGAYQQGANVQYPGHFLAAKDVVVVVPNYRVNNLGVSYFNIIITKSLSLNVQ